MNIQQETKIDISKEHLERKRNYKHALREHLLLDFFVGLIVGTAFGVGTYFALKFVSTEAGLYISMAVLNCIVVSMIIFAYLEYRHIYGKRRIEGEILSAAVENAIERFQTLNPYANILKTQLALTWPLMSTFTEIVDESVRNGGGIMVSADSQKYLEFLEKSLENATESFEAILCGGKEYRYRPRWFFVEGDNLDGPIIRDSSGNPKMDDDKRDWLERVKNKSGLKRVRIMILSNEVLAEDFSEQNKQIREQFLFLNEGVDLYLADIKETPKILGETFWKYVLEDYAIIDNSLVLKHNGTSSMLFASIVSIEPYRFIFDALYSDLRSNKTKRFKKIGKNGIDDVTWMLWLQEHSKGNEVLK